MNLIKDVWLPITRKDGTNYKIAFWQLLDNYEDNPIVELWAPRPDFRNALYQLLIGIIQVAAMPSDEDVWAELWEQPYLSDVFKEKILKYEHCFEIDSAGPAFMQDFDLSEGEEKPVSTLLIEAPGDKTIRDNSDHFIKRDTVNKINPYWSAIALYTLQTFAPSGGAGHRVGLRGGGPLTTMLLPTNGGTLWEKIWINVLCSDDIDGLPGNIQHTNDSDIFPWMKETKESNKKGTDLLPSECNPLHAFFGMPRRIRLKFSNTNGSCDLTGETSEMLVTTYITKNYGNNYNGPWLHPLNAYSFNPKKPEEIPLPIKAQPGGVYYRHWLGLVLKSEVVFPAKVVQLLQSSEERKNIVRKKGFILWAAGFDMDNMKARCWYESTMPVFAIEKSKLDYLSVFINSFINNAQKSAIYLKSGVKAAWFNSPKEVKGDISFLETSFWQNTEKEFYEILKESIDNIESPSEMNLIVERWKKVLNEETLRLFDTWALAQQEDGLDMKRVIKARNELERGIYKITKSLNELKQEEE